MNTALAVLLACALPAAAVAADTQAAAPKADEKTLYAIGAALGLNTQPFALSAAEAEVVQRGFRDAVAGKVGLDAIRDQQTAIATLGQSRQEARGASEKLKGAAYQEKASKEKGAVKTSSGLIYFSLKDGTGAAPAATSTVKVNYRGTTVDGKVFDASDKHGGPATFALNQVVPCWTEGVQKMKVGGKARLVCPPSIAYADRGAGAEIPPGATLDFEVELLEIVTP